MALAGMLLLAAAGGVVVHQQLAARDEQIQAQQKAIGDLQAERDQLNAQVTSAQSQLVDSKAALDQSNAKLDQARKDATNAGAQREALAKVVDVDDRIMTADDKAWDAVVRMDKAVKANDVAGYYHAEQQFIDAWNELQQLRDQRQQALQKV